MPRANTSPSPGSSGNVDATSPSQPSTRGGTDDPPNAVLIRDERGVSAAAGFPILGYDELSVGQVSARLPSLTAPELRKVRDYERRHANRKSVLDAVEKLLG
jgi:hypothetical protein